jgi:hypothetical protein
MAMEHLPLRLLRPSNPSTLQIHVVRHKSENWDYPLAGFSRALEALLSPCLDGQQRLAVQLALHMSIMQLLKSSVMTVTKLILDGLCIWMPFSLFLGWLLIAGPLIHAACFPTLFCIP